MKKWLPNKVESIELLALSLMVLGIQWSVNSWGWTSFFVLGFVWNWAVLNGWVRNQVVSKKYRFSFLRGITQFHDLVVRPARGGWAWLAQILPAGLVLGGVALILESSVPWWSAFLGSLAFILIRRQLREIL